MAEHREGTFEVTSWSEDAASCLEGTVRVTTTRIGQSPNVGMEVDTVADMVMTYRSDDTADCVGHYRVLGRVGARSGSFVLGASGSYDGAEARSAFEVIAGSGTGQFVDIAGSWKDAARRSSTGTYSFDFELPAAWVPHSVGDLESSIFERHAAGVTNHG